MKKYIFFGSITAISFLAGVFCVSYIFSVEINEKFSVLMSSRSLQPQPINIYSSATASTEISPLPTEDEETALLLENLVEYKEKKGEQTFYVSENRKYGYWLEDGSIYILSAIEGQIYWADGKARIDLTKDVVPSGKYENLGCCLHEKDWVDEVLKACKKGKRIKIIK